MNFQIVAGLKLKILKIFCNFLSSQVSKTIRLNTTKTLLKYWYLPVLILSIVYSFLLGINLKSSATVFIYILSKAFLWSYFSVLILIAFQITLNIESFWLIHEEPYIDVESYLHNIRSQQDRSKSIGYLFRGLFFDLPITYIAWSFRALNYVVHFMILVVLCYLLAYWAMFLVAQDLYYTWEFNQIWVDDSFGTIIGFVLFTYSLWMILILIIYYFFSLIKVEINFLSAILILFGAYLSFSLLFKHFKNYSISEVELYGKIMSSITFLVFAFLVHRVDEIRDTIIQQKNADTKSE